MAVAKHPQEWRERLYEVSTRPGEGPGRAKGHSVTSLPSTDPPSNPAPGANLTPLLQECKVHTRTDFDPKPDSSRHFLSRKTLIPV